MGASLRIDKWLWCTRFFRTRGLASKAVTSGHVRLNGARVKASRDVKVGDMLRIQRGADLIECAVLALPERRGPASEAQSCYAETAQSAARREAVASEMRAISVAVRQPTEGRPDKRTRRMLRARLRESPDR